MGYNPNTVYCNLAELEKAGLATIFAFNSLQRDKPKEESLVDLKLGRLGESGKGLSQSCRDQTTSLMDPFSSSAGSSKRKTPGSAGHLVSCLVDGCKAGLSKCRDYHRRHNVCEMHSKTPRVTIGGHEQRFCQQCQGFRSVSSNRIKQAKISSFSHAFICSFIVLILYCLQGVSIGGLSLSMNNGLTISTAS